jgi:hypothetical protein
MSQPIRVAREAVELLDEIAAGVITHFPGKM